MASTVPHTDAGQEGVNCNRQFGLILTKDPGCILGHHGQRGQSQKFQKSRFHSLPLFQHMASPAQMMVMVTALPALHGEGVP